MKVGTVTRETEQLVEELLEHEHVEMERTAVGKQVDKPPQVREEGDTLIISVVEELVVVEAASSFETGGSRPSNTKQPYHG